MATKKLKNGRIKQELEKVVQLLTYKDYIGTLSLALKFNEACTIAGSIALNDHYGYSTRTKWYKLKTKQLEFIRTYLTKKQNLRITEIMLQLEWEGPIKTIKKANLKAKKNGSRY